MMWGCAAAIMVTATLAFATSAYFLLFLIPCILMMGAMMWMMIGGGTHGGEQHLGLDPHVHDLAGNRLAKFGSPSAGCSCWRSASS